MEITLLNVNHYKSIKETGRINLHEKINILAGKNNTGKSAFIEAIYKTVNGNLVDALGIQQGNLNVEMEIKVNPEELETLYDLVDNNYQIKSLERFRINFEYQSSLNLSCITKVEMFHEGEFRKLYLNKSRFSNGILISEFEITTKIGGKTNYHGSAPKFLVNLFVFLKNKVVYISGSRYVPQVEGTTLQEALSTDGSNLNAFLYTLHNNHEKNFDIILDNFIKIFDDVISISTPINSDNNTYISIYFEGLNTPIPLFNCGSGYTHVLLLLCVLFTKKDSIVLFDEPQVYLHPSAEKAIYDLVSDVREHQFIFTTHSPILINYPIGKNLLHVSKERGNSTFIQLDKMQGILSDIGVSNSDYALSDKVIFVEGETEEAAIPLILSKYGLKQVGYNYRLLNMKGTGKDFTKKTSMNNHKQKLDLILGGLSQSPIPYKIVIDADNKSDEKLEEIREQYKDNIVILDRREYENYFLDSFKELAQVIKMESGIEDIDQVKIEENIKEMFALLEDKKLYPKNTESPLNDIVGSEVLERLFDSYSLVYDKIDHGVILTELILNNNPEKFEFIKNELKEFIESKLAYSL